MTQSTSWTLRIGLFWFAVYGANAEEARRECPGADSAELAEKNLASGAVFRGPPDGRRGRGCLWLPDGSKYVGEFENNLINHAGRFEWYKDGSPSTIYEGEWRDGLMRGVGHLRDLSTGSSFQGRFIDNEFAYGIGHIFYPGGGEYSGGMEGPKRDGQGYLRSRDGNYYEGFWLNDVLDRGQAKEVLQDGRRYEGQYAQGRPNGTGTLISEDQLQKYVGEIKDGVPEGRGTRYTYFDSKQVTYDRYDGEFRDGLYDGIGRLDHSHREPSKKIQGHGPLAIINTPGMADTFAGLFRRGELRDGQVYFDNGIRYTGNLFELRPHGTGTVYYSNGLEKTYNFVDGLPENY
ncbi:hypothetical protein [Sinorhizobium meliloti]|uniref:hypothetical protein n=1 Tax=Rhizobium meliloti TaxID=382 RepID=UPI000FD813AC|nr:hypothetical protein [Sinorhizobium meliloti]RVG82173.1 hypothetical protein CN219_22295 [Sinorhizobium meliloti]RVI29088.1 hypothetical protein CN197_24530 [Sinorhizobium meliloti]RVI41919.1 hypothetical protein CN196_23745 [Sinorhizobium meliloti]RVJ25776.1 hypothetical protein CN177_12775 [Sinorhizobium meliloti]RVK00693.1 hypothetical protein CN170_12885 [Sinorhizobium meliloti]